MSIGSRRRLWIALGLAPWLTSCAPTRSAPASPAPAGDREVRSSRGASCRPARSAAELRADVRRLLDPLFATPTPLLPDRWPTPMGIVVYTYESTPLPTGAVAYAVRGPSARIVFDGPELAARIERLDPDIDLGTRRERWADESRRFANELLEAERALVEIVAGCRESVAVRPALDPYRVWFRAHPLIAADLRQRLGDFSRWLEEETR